MKKRNLVLAMSVVFLFMVCFGATATAAKYNWRLAHEELETGFMGTFAAEFKKKLAEKSDGAINLDIYPASTLGVHADMVELVQQGVIEFNFADAGHLGGFMPEIQAYLLHYVFPKDIDVVLDVLQNGKIAKLMDEKFVEKRLKPLTTLTEGWQVITSNKPLRNLDEFKGFKIRTMTSRLIVENFKAYKASPVPTPWGEVYSGLQLGVIDGQVNPVFFIEEQNLDQVQDHLTFAYTNPFILSLVTNPTFFDSLPNNIQQIIVEAVRETATFAHAWQKDFNENRLTKMQKRSPKLQIIKLSQAEVDALKKAAQPVKDVYYEIGGKNAREFLDTLEKDVETAMQKKGN